MKRVYKILSVVILCVILVFTGCRGKNSSGSLSAETVEGQPVSENESTKDDTVESTVCETSGDNPVQTQKVYNIDTDKLPYTQQEIYSQLFDINNKIVIKVNISDAELEKMQKDYDNYTGMGSKSPIYRKASVDITITTSGDSYTYHIDEVGVRMKGNTSRTDFYSREEGKYNLIHLKLAFQETFDDSGYYGKDAKNWGDDKTARDARKDRTFATLEKIDIKWNRNDDSTYIREYYAYEMYRAYGVLAPHTNIASVDVAGAHEGVFTIYEPVDKIFIEKYVDEKDRGGDLYKCGWTYNGATFTKDCSIGIEDEDEGRFYNYDLKTNKKTSQNTQLKNLINVLNSGRPSKEALANVIDMDYFLKYEAVSYFAGSPDDLRNNYNNYYIYFLKSSGKVVFIPCDLDRCFGVTSGWNPSGNGMTDINPFSKYAAGANSRQPNPLYIYTVDEGGYYVSEFGEALKKIAAGNWLTTANFDKYYYKAYNNYSSDTKPSENYHNAGGYNFTFSNTASNGLNSNDKNASFKEYADAKMTAYNKYISKINEYSSSVTVQPFYIRGTFTGWNIDDRYEMVYNSSSKTYSYTLKLNESSEWKINNGVDGDAGLWYGSEDVVSYTAAGWMGTGDRGNVVLSSGTYIITFNPGDESITIK